MLNKILMIAGTLSCALFGYGQLPAPWTVNPANYNYSMTLTGQILENCTELTDENNAIAAFVGGQCRGFAQTDVDAGTRKLGFLTIYSNNVSGEAVELRFFNAASGQEITALDGCTFTSNGVVGTIANPFTLLNNHTPTGISLTNNVVQESTPVGGTIGTFSGTDSDTGQTLSFMLSGALPDNAAFGITGTTLTLETVLDFATQSSYAIEVTVNDGQGCGFTDTFAILVDDNAFPPVAENDTVVTDEDNAVAITVLANDSDYDNDIDTASVHVITTPDFGTVSVDTNGVITYTPNADYFGPDVFTYVVCDLTNTGALCDTAQVVITVNPVPDAPFASDDSASTDEDTQVTIDVALNDTDIENDIDPSSVEIIQAPENGIAAVSGSVVTYIPNAQFNGFDTIVYRIGDQTVPAALWDTAAVFITVNPISDAPLDIVIDTVTIIEDNEPHFLVSHLQTIDNDLPDDGFVYTLVIGENDSDNAQFTIEGDALYINGKTIYDIKNVYRIRLRTTDAAGLWYEEAFDITVIDIAGNDIPLPASTYISNNGDGKNDYLAIENVEIYDYFSLTVFDQFGNVVYEKEAPYTNDWDGTKNGEKLPTGGYYYLFMSESKAYKGNVTIVN